jgi:UDP-galactopyranose mutase
MNSTGKSYLIVGSGIFGATCARQLTDAGKKCLVIDQRAAVAGNCHDYPYENYYVSSFGGHYFHTNSDYVWEYVNKFTEFIPYNFTAKVENENNIYSYPINLLTMHQLWGITTPEEARKKIEEVKIKIPNPKNFEEKVLSLVGEEIYDKFIYGYNKKMWSKDPKDIPASIVNRIVVRYDYDDRYFSDKYQGQPKNGYTQMVENMLDGINVRLTTSFDKSMEKYFDKVIYTGCIDEYYNYCCGNLEYRGVNRQWTEEEIGAPMITYPNEEIPYIRKFSYKYPYERSASDKHMTSVEYSINGLIVKDYPVNDEKNNYFYEKYKAIQNDKVIFGGRLGSFRYWNMDATIASALNLTEKLI